MVEKNNVKFYPILFLTGFAINLVWEINQMPYFAGKPGNTYAEGLFYCSLASIIDGLTVVSLCFLASRVFTINTLRFYLLAAFSGALCAVIFENIAFYLKLWSYRESMPIVPIIEVGFLPFIQLTTLVPLSIFLTDFIYGKFVQTK